MLVLEAWHDPAQRAPTCFTEYVTSSDHSCMSACLVDHTLTKSTHYRLSASVTRFNLYKHVDEGIPTTVSCGIYVLLAKASIRCVGLPCSSEQGSPTQQINAPNLGCVLFRRFLLGAYPPFLAPSRFVWICIFLSPAEPLQRNVPSTFLKTWIFGIDTWSSTRCSHTRNSTHESQHWSWMFCMLL